jgi:hypothetical protein
MARGVNKSELIRKYFESNPQASVKDCIAALGEGGIEVSYPLVFGVRGRMNPEEGKGDTYNSKVETPISSNELKMVGDFVEKSNLDPDLATRILAEFSNLVRAIGTNDRFDRVLEEFGRVSNNSSSVIVDPPEVFPGVVQQENAVVEGGSSYFDVNEEEDD